MIAKSNVPPEIGTKRDDVDERDADFAAMTSRAHSYKVLSLSVIRSIGLSVTHTFAIIP